MFLISINWYRYWATQNPRWVGQLNTVGAEKVMAWAGIIHKTIIGPFFFTDTVNGESYTEMLTDFVLPDLHRRGFDSEQIYYMHDGAPAHIPNYVRQALDDNFLGWIGHGEGNRKILPWPARSPDLNMLDFFLWGVLQHRVYIEQSESIEVLKNTITQESRNIAEDVLERVQEHLVKRLKKCVEQNGELFEHLLK